MATIERIAELTQDRGLSESTVQALRAAWPGVHFSYCMDDDICGVAPVRALPGFNVYLVDGRAHCLNLTGDPQAATGLVLAQVDADDE